MRDLSGIPIVDTHVHVWKRDAPWMDWLKDRPSSWDVVRRDFSWEELSGLLDESGIADLILVQASPDCRETKEYLELAAQHSRILGIVGWVSLTSADRTATDLASLEGPGYEKLVGIRNSHGWAPDGEILASPAVIASCRLLAERGLPLDLHFRDQRELGLAMRIAEEVPELRLIIDHMGKPLIGDLDDYAAWRDAMTRLALCPNIYLKYSGWTTFLGEAKAGAIRPYITHALAEFGARRIMFASNWPVALVADSFENTFDASIEALPEISPANLKRLLRDTAIDCYLGPRR